MRVVRAVSCASRASIFSMEPVQSEPDGRVGNVVCRGELLQRAGGEDEPLDEPGVFVREQGEPRREFGQRRRLHKMKVLFRFVFAT